MEFDPPVETGGLFGCDSDEDEPAQKEGNKQPSFHEKDVTLGAHRIRVREFGFHTTNANFIWPGNETIAKYLEDHIEEFRGRHILELGSATGLLSIFMRKIGLDLVTSDYADDEIEQNIYYNFDLNAEPRIRHIPHTWGTPWPEARGSFDVIVASDILLYVHHYGSLIETLKQIMTEDMVFYTMWKRRLGKGTENFFEKIKGHGFDVEILGQGMHRIRKTAAASIEMVER